MTEASCPQDCGLPKFFRLKKKSEMQWDDQTTPSSVWSY